MISIVVLTYNACSDIEQIIPLLQKQVIVGEHELIVIDSGSTDGTQKKLKEYGIEPVVISSSYF